mmetsp:Transcript_3613/g.14095  ORF Transcript_3613/g.14095 Transcript_3613/m.14095 type:complete len:213 (+) Transcript_3613:1488-2126(+)
MSVTLRYPRRARYAARSAGLTAVPVIHGIAAVVTMTIERSSVRKSLAALTCSASTIGVISSFCVWYASRRAADDASPSAPPLLVGGHLSMRNVVALSVRRNNDDPRGSVVREDDDDDAVSAASETTTSGSFVDDATTGGRGELRPRPQICRSRLDRSGCCCLRWPKRGTGGATAVHARPTPASLTTTAAATASLRFAAIACARDTAIFLSAR